MNNLVVKKQFDAPVSIASHSILGDVADDWEAVEKWLREVQAKSKNDKQATVTTYRFHLVKLRWFCENEIGVSPSRWTVDEVAHFREFLKDLPKHAVCAKKPPADKRRKNGEWVFVAAGEPGWTPFRSQPSASSQGDILRFVHSLFSAWHKASYIGAHPMALSGAASPKETNVDRSIRLDLYDLVLDVMGHAEKKTFTDRQKHLRDRFVFMALRGLGLRASELVGAKMGAFFFVTIPRTGERFWVFKVSKETAKGGMAREIPVTCDVWGAFVDYRVAYGLDPRPAHQETIPLLLSVRTKAVEINNRSIKDSASRRFFGAWRAIETRQGLYSIVKDRLKETAAVLRQRGEEQSADDLLKASPHWLRHTFGKAQLLAGQKMRETVAALGHADERTAMRYTHQGAVDLIQAWERESPGSVAKESSLMNGIAPVDDGVANVDGG